jgi:hypothetical protein
LRAGSGSQNLLPVRKTIVLYLPFMNITERQKQILNPAGLSILFILISFLFSISSSWSVNSSLDGQAGLFINGAISVSP